MKRISWYIKRIRDYLEYSQEEFADELSVAFSTVNRWERGEAFPNDTAQIAIYSICERYNIPAGKLVLDKLSQESNDVIENIGEVKLYHGSREGISGEIAPISRKGCDFGRGFYMGTDIEQALTLVSENKHPKLYIVTLNLDKISLENFGSGFDWVMIIAYFRGRLENIKGTKLYNKYKEMAENGADVYYGEIADDRILDSLRLFYNDYLTDTALLKSLSAIDLGWQYSAKNKKACREINIKKEIEILRFEQLALEKILRDKRNEGRLRAEMIRRENLRNGRFFSEILEDDSLI